MTQTIATVRSSATYAGHLFNLFERNADRLLLTDARTGADLTYGRLLHDSRVMATYLQDRGIKPGDTVALSMENSTELAVLYFACLHAGARAVPINPAYHARDYNAIMEGISARLLFVSPTVRARLAPGTAEKPRLDLVCFKAEAEDCKTQHLAYVNFDFKQALSQYEPSARTFAQAADDDIAFTMYTSGSTGLPKGINIRFGGLLGNGRLFCSRMGVGPENRFYNVLAMTYLGGLYNLLLIPILAEGSIILDSVFGPTNVYGFWEQVRQHGVNTLWFSPTMLSMLLMLENDEDLSFLKSQIRLGICGMAPLPVDLKRRFEARFGFRLFENYGLSETTFLATDHPSLGNKSGSVGTVLEGVAIQILDNDYKPLPAGHEGQIGVETPYLMAGYENEEDVRAALARTGGHFLTGDLGYLDAQGELFITGRLKDLIIRGGVNISPKTIEDVIYRMDAVEEAAVVGLPHAMYGEEVALVIKLRESYRDRITVDVVQRFCDANIAHFQRPKLIFFIDQIPKGATGKIQKNVIKRMLLEKIDPLNG